MKRFFNNLKNKAVYVAGLGVASLVGGLTAGIVMASIPDNQGVIHVCRLDSTGALRMIDTASQSCNGLETEVTWDQGGVKAYSRVFTDGTFDSSRSKNIVDIDKFDNIASRSVYCIDTSTTASNVNVTTETQSSNTFAASAAPGSSEWSLITDSGSVCSSGYDVVVATGSEDSFYISIN